MTKDEFEWQMAEFEKIEKNMFAEIYINCYGAEDEFFREHLSNSFQIYEYEHEYEHISCPHSKKSCINSFLSFKYVKTLT
jgi:hypothetical protein